MKQIHFIVNPIAGYGKHFINQKFLDKFFDQDNYTITIKNSDYKKHAKILTKFSIVEGADIVVACGGDGTINEVASCLVNTNIALGIILLGSDDGLAFNLKIQRALKVPSPS